MADIRRIADCVEIGSAWLKSYIATEVFGLYHLHTFSIVLHLCYSAAQELLAHCVHKAWLQKHFPRIVPNPLNSATDVE